MLEAKKSKWFEKIFTVYNRNLIKRRFNSLRISGLENLRAKTQEFPLIIYSNHSSWWDGLVLFEILSGFELESYIMMEEKQLRDLPLFRRLGAFSIVRENPREALKSIDYAVRILKADTSACLCIFPQGAIRPNESRPLGFFNGISKIIARTGPCYVLPIALRYEFLGDFKPEAFAAAGKLELIELSGRRPSEDLTRKLEPQLTYLLDEVTEQIVKQNFRYFEKLL